jgi:hypothetical protein
MNATQIAAIVRLILTLVGAEMIDEGQLQQAIGAVIVLVTLGWSLYEKYRPLPAPPADAAPPANVLKYGKKDR